MRFKRFTFSWNSPLIGFHLGKNPVSGQRFLHVAPIPFFGIDFNLPPYDLNDQARERLYNDKNTILLGEVAIALIGLIEAVEPYLEKAAPHEELFSGEDLANIERMHIAQKRATEVLTGIKEQTPPS